METITRKKFDELDPIAQDMILNATGWNGESYSNADGITVTLHGEGEVAEYSVHYPEGFAPEAPETVEETPTVEVAPEVAADVAPVAETESVPTEEVPATDETVPTDADAAVDAIETTPTTEETPVETVETDATPTETAPVEPALAE